VSDDDVVRQRLLDLLDDVSSAHPPEQAVERAALVGGVELSRQPPILIL
jgi:hypothetical protein